MMRKGLRCRDFAEYDAKKGVASYIEEWFNESYLVPDSSVSLFLFVFFSYLLHVWTDDSILFCLQVVLNLNPFFLLEDDPTPHGTSWPQELRPLYFLRSSLSPL